MRHARTINREIMMAQAMDSDELDKVCQTNWCTSVPPQDMSADVGSTTGNKLYNWWTR